MKSERDPSDYSDDSLMGTMAKNPSGPAAKQAFETLFKRHSALVLGYSRRFVLDRNMAEDIAQEVWMKTIRAATSNPPSYQARGQFRPWLLVMTRNTAFDSLRSSGKYADAFREADGDENEYDENQADALSGLVSRAEIGRVRQAMDELPAAQRTALSLHLIEELNYAEIAVAMGLSLGSIKTHLHRGRIALIAKLKSQGGRP